MLSIIGSIAIIVTPIVLVIWLIIFRRIKKNIPEELKGGNNNGIQKEKQKGTGSSGEGGDGGDGARLGREGRRETRIRELESRIESGGGGERRDVEDVTEQQRRIQTDLTLNTQEPERDTQEPERDTKRNWTEFS